MPSGLLAAAWRRGTGAVQAAITGAQFAALQRPAVALSTLLQGLSTLRPAVAVQTTFTGLVTTVPAVLVARLSSGSSTASVLPALLSSSLYSAPSTAAPKPAWRIAQTTVGLVGTYGASSSTSSGGWTNPANAAGTANTTVATMTGSLTAATSGTLTLPYPDSVNKTALTITNVTLRVYYATAGIGALTTPVVSASYTAGGAAVQLFSETNTAASNLTTPRTFTLPLTTWAQVDAFQATFTANIHATVNSGVTVSVDALELVVTATRTE